MKTNMKPTGMTAKENVQAAILHIAEGDPKGAVAHLLDVLEELVEERQE